MSRQARGPAPYNAQKVSYKAPCQRCSPPFLAPAITHRLRGPVRESARAVSGVPPLLPANGSLHSSASLEVSRRGRSRARAPRARAHTPSSPHTLTSPALFPQDTSCAGAAPLPPRGMQARQRTTAPVATMARGARGPPPTPLPVSALHRVMRPSLPLVTSLRTAPAGGGGGGVPVGKPPTHSAEVTPLLLPVNRSPRARGSQAAAELTRRASRGPAASTAALQGVAVASRDTASQGHAPLGARRMCSAHTATTPAASPTASRAVCWEGGGWRGGQAGLAALLQPGPGL